jgi:hypothetical protein
VTPTEHEGTVAVDAAARAVYDAQRRSMPSGAASFDDLDVLQRNHFRESVLPFVWAALEALPDRPTATTTTEYGVQFDTGDVFTTGSEDSCRSLAEVTPGSRAVSSIVTRYATVQTDWEPM